MLICLPCIPVPRLPQIRWAWCDSIFLGAAPSIRDWCKLRAFQAAWSAPEHRPAPPGRTGSSLLRSRSSSPDHWWSMTDLMLKSVSLIITITDRCGSYRWAIGSCWRRLRSSTLEIPKQSAAGSHPAPGPTAWSTKWLTSWPNRPNRQQG